MRYISFGLFNCPDVYISLKKIFSSKSKYEIQLNLSRYILFRQWFAKLKYKLLRTCTGMGEKCYAMKNIIIRHGIPKSYDEYTHILKV